MSTNGKTATDFSGIVDAVGADAAADTAAAGTETAAVVRFGRRSTANPAMTKPIRETAMMVVFFVGRTDGDGAEPRGITVAVCMATRTAAMNFGIERAISAPLAFNHRDEFKKYSNAAGNGAWSTLSGTTGWRFEAARSTSLRTCGESAEFLDRMSTRALAASMA
jgi:hypothetical protein